jgi:hypothetical protein
MLRNQNMAKPKFPSKTCPKCGKLIHARLQKHEACGWVMANGQAAPVAKRAIKRRKLGRPRKAHAGSNAGGISLADIRAVKALTDRLGAEKVRQLAM